MNIFTINILNSKPTFSSIKENASGKASSEPRKFNTAEPDCDINRVSSAFLAQTTFKSKSEIKAELVKLVGDKYYLPDDFYEKFDYENGDEHLRNIKYLLGEEPAEYGDAFRNGYFYSKEGLDAFNILKENYSASSNDYCISLLDIMFSEKISDVLKAEKRGIFPLKEKMTDVQSDDFDRIRDYISLNDEEYERIKKYGFDKKGIHYASDNKDINSLFEKLQNVESEYQGWPASILKKIEKQIKDCSQGDDEKIKDLSKKMSNVKNKKFFVDLAEKENINLPFIVDNIDSIHTLMHKKLDGFNDNNFGYQFHKFMEALTPDNINAFKKLLDVKGLDYKKAYKTLQYMYTKENVEVVENIIESINKGEDDIIALPSYKHAKINERIRNEKNKELKEYSEDESLDEICKKSPQGDIFAYGDDVYIKDKDELVKIDLDKEMYKKLFPKYKTLCVQQGKDTDDCYFLSGGLIAFFKNPYARVDLLKMLKQDGDDVVVTIPAFKDYPVRFKNCEVQDDNLHAKTSLGNLILEQAYAKAKYASLNNVEGDASNVDADIAMKFIHRGFQSDVFNELTGRKDGKDFINKSYEDFSESLPSNKEWVSKDEMKTLLDKYSDSDKYLLCCSSGTQDDGYLPDYGITQKHAYAIEKIDSKNKKVTIINPYNSLYTAEISYDQFVKYFSNLSVMKVG